MTLTSSRQLDLSSLDRRTISRTAEGSSDGTTHPHGPGRAHDAGRVDRERLLRRRQRRRGSRRAGPRAAARRGARDPAAADRRRLMTVLPETAAVHWRPRIDPARLRRRGRGWTLSTLAHTIPFLATAVLLIALEPLSFPVAAIAVVHAWE